MNGAYHQYVEEMQRMADVRYASALLQWDQETYMPPKGGNIRGRQIATLSHIAHEQFVSKPFVELVKNLSDDESLNFIQKRNIAQTLRDIERQLKLPGQFVRELAESVNRSFLSWIEARRKNDFSVFEPDLSKLIDLKIREAAYIGYKSHPYEALMQEFEQDLEVADADALFQQLKPGLQSIINRISNRPSPDIQFLQQHYPKQQQWDFSLQLIKKLHFDFDAGRQDISEHPFTTNFSNLDVRITTRIDETDPANMIWSCIHECGHALYEQGLPSSEYGLPSGEYCSLGIHESQSRLWENAVGRSRPFWEYHFPYLKQTFEEQLREISLDQFYQSINYVHPSLIRTEADELTYHFHIMIRYEIEKLLISKMIKPKDIPAIWNEQYKRLLGISPSNDLNGCLQDVHWGHGSFGYFPTYSLGSLYAAQFFNKIEQQYPNLVDELRKGNTSIIWNWLKEHIYPYGKTLSSAELCIKATGSKLNSGFFIEYANKKFGAIYGF